MAADGVAAAIAWTAQVVVIARHDDGPGAAEGTVIVIGAVVATVAAMASQDDYRSWMCVGGPGNLARVLRATAVSVLVVGLTAAVVDIDVSWTQAVLGGCWALLAVGLGRWFFSIWLARQRRRNGLVDRLLLVGSGDTAYGFWRHVTSRPDSGREIVGYAGRPRDRTPTWRLSCLGTVSDAPRVAAELGLTGIVIAPDAVAADELGPVIRRAHSLGLDVELVGGPALVHPRRLSVTDVAHRPVLFVEPHPVGHLRDRGKRLFDLTVGGALLVVVSPLMVVVAIATVLDDGRPVFYRQRRVGRDRTPFRLWKFRTMHRGADRFEGQLCDRNERGQGPLFKIADDPRTTRVGRILRATSVDELPQLFNVVTGSMSLVGPRPALVIQEAEFDPELQTRSRVKPGMTGLWQVEARDNPDFHAYRQLDLFYAENWSFALDIAILAWTIPSLVRHGLTVRRQRSAATEPAAVPMATTPGGRVRDVRTTPADVDAPPVSVDGTTLIGLGPR